MEAGVTIGRDEEDYTVALFDTKPTLRFVSLLSVDFHWEEGEWLPEEHTIAPKCLVLW